VGLAELKALIRNLGKSTCTNDNTEQITKQVPEPLRKSKNSVTWCKFIYLIVSVSVLFWATASLSE